MSKRGRPKPSAKDPCAGKARFASWDEAHLALTEAKIQRALRGRQGRRELRSYYHGPCNGWHLTSSPEQAGVTR